MHYDQEKKKKGGGGKLIAVVIIVAIIVVGAVAVFLNLDKLKYYVEHGELPDPDYTESVTVYVPPTPLPTATPEPLPPVNPAENTVETRFNPPAGYVRVPVEPDSFGQFLRSYPLKAYGTIARLATGADNPNAPTEGVFDQAIRANGLQQCADAIIRLYAEYRYKRAEKFRAEGDTAKDTQELEYITFDCYTTPVFKLDYSSWITGMRVRANGKNLEWYKPDDADLGVSEKTFLYYLDNVFLYANTYSLKNQMMQIDSTDIQVGDCLIITADQTGTSDGHAIIVVDVAVNTTTGKKAFILAEGNTPSTETYILKDAANDTVWFTLNEDGTFSKVSYDGRLVTYPLDAFRRFKR